MTVYIVMKGYTYDPEYDVHSVWSTWESAVKEADRISKKYPDTDIKEFEVDPDKSN
jgi:hypothetical protein